MARIKTIAGVRAVFLMACISIALIGTHLASSASDGFGWGGTSITVAADEEPGGFGWGGTTPDSTT